MIIENIVLLLFFVEVQEGVLGAILVEVSSHRFVEANASGAQRVVRGHNVQRNLLRKSSADGFNDLLLELRKIGREGLGDRFSEGLAKLLLEIDALLAKLVKSERLGNLEEVQRVA